MIQKILVVDDDANWCFISKRMLRKASEVKEIVTAKNGLEALNNLQHCADNGEKMPEFIFLDIKMPVMDGFEFLDAVKSMDSLDLSQTRIFICSSSIHPKDHARAEQHAVAGFLNKSFTTSELRDIMVNAML